jgi:V-type H+-transporting ATPase subunit H
MSTEFSHTQLDAGHDSEAAAILAKTIPWDALLTSNVLTDRDVQMIRRFDKRDKFTQAALWEKARLQRLLPARCCRPASGVAWAVPRVFLSAPPHSCPACRQEGAAYAAVFVNVLRSVSKDETAQYVLALVEEALAGAFL